MNKRQRQKHKKQLMNSIQTLVLRKDDILIIKLPETCDFSESEEISKLMQEWGNDTGFTRWLIFHGDISITKVHVSDSESNCVEV